MNACVCSGPGSQYSPDCAGMYMDGQHMMRATGKLQPIMSFDRVELRIGLNIIWLETIKNKKYVLWNMVSAHSRVHKSMAELCSNVGDSTITKGVIGYFSLRMRETPIFLLPVKNLTSPSCSLTPISYNMKHFSALRPQVKAKLHIFSLRMREMVIFLLPVKNMTSQSCSPPQISYKAREFWRYVNI